MSHEDAVAGALVGTFVGDALGRPFEGAPPARGRDVRDRLGWLDHEAVLTHTDDTQMALALAEHLARHGDVDPAGLAEDFATAYEPERGYGAGIRRLVEAWTAGMDVGAAAMSVFPEGSFGNGAAMRVAPVGAAWAHDLARVDELARAQAMVTHAHPVGIDGACVQARAVALAARDGRFGAEQLADVTAHATTAALREPLARAATWVDRWGHGDGDLATVAAELGTSVVADRSVPAALWCAVAGPSPADAVGLALGLGGDADTIAAMAGAIRGAAAGPHAVAHDWLIRLEDGPHGISYAFDLAARLAAAVR